MQEAGVCSHLEALVAEAHEDSWFVVEGAPDPVVFQRGTKAGNPLGDIVFNYAMTVTLNFRRR